MQLDPFRSLLLHPEHWTLAATGIPPPPEPPVSPTRRRWVLRHSRPHSHAEVMIALRGRTPYGLAGRFVPVRPGTVILFRPLEPHQSGYPPEESPISHLWFSLMRDHFTARLVTFRNRRLTSALMAQGAFAWSCPEWVFRPPEQEPPDRIAFRLRLLAMTLVQALLDNPSSSPSASRSPDESVRAIIHSIQRHLQQTAGKGDSLESLARIAGYSPFHFHRLFRRLAGSRLHDFINQCRLIRVRTRLAEGWTQRAIAEELGFASPQSFSRWWRRFS